MKILPLRIHPQVVQVFLL